MTTFLFELKKIWRQKKLLWLFIIILFCISGLFFQNYQKQSTMSERASKAIEPYIADSNTSYNNLKAIEMEGSLTELQTKQLEEVIKVGKELVDWKAAIYNGKWDKIPNIEHEFLMYVQQFISHGGDFKSLEGSKLEKAMKKNDWLLAHNLSYADEAFPVTPVLYLKDVIMLLFGGGSIFLLLLFFGNIITTEKEHNTWRIITTQPIPKWNIIVGKYISLLFMLFIFLVMILSIGIIVPLIFGERVFDFQYPQYVSTGKAYSYISTSSYILRACMFFGSACLLTFAVVTLLSNWLKNSFTLILSTCFILVVGYFTTDDLVFFQNTWNPYQVFHFSELIANIPKSTDWLYLLSALIWSISLVGISIIFSEKHTGLFNFSGHKKPFRNGQTKSNVQSIRTISVFEFRKTRRRGLLKQVNLLFSFLIILGYFFLAGETEDKEKEYVKRVHDDAQQVEMLLLPTVKESIATLEKEQQTENIQLDLMRNTLAYGTKMIEKNNDAIASYEQGDWRPLVDYQLFQNRAANGDIDTGQLIIEYKTDLGQFSIDASIAEKEWLIEHDIRPIFSGEYVRTIFWDEDLKNDVLKANQKIDNSGLYSLYYFFENYLYFILILPFLFLFGSGLAGERGKKYTLNFLKTQPIKERDILTGKTLTAAILSMVSCAALCLLLVLVGTLFSRFGDLNYPVLYYDHTSIVESVSYTGHVSKNGGFHFLALGNYLWESMLQVFLILLLILVLSNFLSIFLKNIFTIYIATIAIFTVGYVVSTQILEDYSYLSPFTYLDIPKVVNGELTMVLNQPGIQVKTGCIVLIVSTVIVLITGYLSFYLKTRLQRQVKVARSKDLSNKF
ncbi:ABC transporter permease [Peribacillus butanolivorans]|uniref:ABC transporter permease n=1 Tax=Peribacillus butanolivorans TaxID=421767 RepID=UPI0037CB456F